jgi:hypothetical protein
MRALFVEFTPWVLALDLSAVPDIAYTALMMLTDGEEQVREAGTVITLVAMNPYVLEVISKRKGKSNCRGSLPTTKQ